MDKKSNLLINMIVKGLLGFFLLGLMLFGAAGSLRYTNAWLLIAALFLLMLAMGTLLLLKYPETLERRLKAKEKESAQKGYISLIGVLFLASFVLAGLDYRFHWTRVPFGVSLCALLLMIVGYGLFAATILQNAYASRVVEVQKEQTVVTTGLYAVVRHPMYLACLLLFPAMPLVLGSYIALFPMLLLPIGLILRIKNEEAVLRTELNGYTDYMQKTKYRLIPFIW
ncbi:MAG: isoprenylcysteine carboxylmethyltransferase family protein [Candidatus Pelethousia sp.]|nr:isoprenylcysteine carboxylmethyltransferase family protein [Candidatus Pelethousia sp.]